MRDKQLLLDLHDLWSRREKGHIVVAGGFAACLSAYYPDLSKVEVEERLQWLEDAKKAEEEKQRSEVALSKVTQRPALATTHFAKPHREGCSAALRQKDATFAVSLKTRSAPASGVAWL